MLMPKSSRKTWLSLSKRKIPCARTMDCVLMTSSVQPWLVPPFHVSLHIVSCQDADEIIASSENRIPPQHRGLSEVEAKADGSDVGSRTPSSVDTGVDVAGDLPRVVQGRLVSEIHSDRSRKPPRAILASAGQYPREASGGRTEWPKSNREGCEVGIRDGGCERLRRHGGRRVEIASPRGDFPSGQR